MNELIIDFLKVIKSVNLIIKKLGKE